MRPLYKIASFTKQAYSGLSNFRKHCPEVTHAVINEVFKCFFFVLFFYCRAYHDKKISLACLLKNNLLIFTYFYDILVLIA